MKICLLEAEEWISHFKSMGMGLFLGEGAGSNIYKSEVCLKTTSQMFYILSAVIIYFKKLQFYLAVMRLLTIISMLFDNGKSNILSH